MTLGKIERFWKSLWKFLQRAQFDSFEQAMGAPALWVECSGQSGHTGSGNCVLPAAPRNRHELKQTIEMGLEEDALELALTAASGPLYVVGRGGTSGL